MPAGYVYALINPSMKGLVKIGKTQGDPEDRANEFSRAVGVGTPFIVAYSEYFADCDAVEKHVHAALQLQGYRPSHPHDFFEAPLSVVVKAFSDVPAFTRRTAETKSFRPDTSLEIHDPPNDLGEMIFQEAMAYRQGLDGYFQDYEEAVRLLKRADDLGVLRANRYIGDIITEQKGFGPAACREALEHYKTGASKGDWMCYADMAQIFSINKEAENTEKAASRYFDGLIQDMSWASDDENFSLFKDITAHLQIFHSIGAHWSQYFGNIHAEESDFRFPGIEKLHLVRRVLRKRLHELYAFLNKLGEKVDELWEEGLVESRAKPLDTWGEIIDNVYNFIEESRPKSEPFCTLRYLFFALIAEKISNLIIREREADPTTTSVRTHIRDLLSAEQIIHVLEEEELLETEYFAKAKEQYSSEPDSELEFADYELANQILDRSPDRRCDFYQIIALNESLQKFIVILAQYLQRHESLTGELDAVSDTPIFEDSNERSTRIVRGWLSSLGIDISRDDEDDAIIFVLAVCDQSRRQPQ